jgi:putative acetyltransferase
MGDWEDAHSKRQWWQQLLQLRSAADAGTVVPLAIEVNGRFAGQLTLGAIQHGVGSDCWVGYWVHSALSGQGVATAAVALGVDHALQRVGVHRVVATYLPSNTASGRVLEKNGFRQEGYLHRNLHIDGRWQDHYLVALCDDDYSLSCIERLRHKGQVV